MAIDSTVGGASANTYVLEPAATLQVPLLVSPAVLALWTTATTTVRENALMKATISLNSLESRYIGLRTTPDVQALAWPRSGALTAYQRLFSSTAIPDELIKAQVVYAALDVAGEIDITAADNYSGIVEEHAGPVGARYSSTQRARGINRAPAVTLLLMPLLKNEQAGAYRL